MGAESRKSHDAQPNGPKKAFSKVSDITLRHDPVVDARQGSIRTWSSAAMVRRVARQTPIHNRALNGDGMLIDVFLLSIVNSHQRFDRFNNSLCIAYEISVDTCRL